MKRAYFTAFNCHAISPEFGYVMSRDAKEVIPVNHELSRQSLTQQPTQVSGIETLDVFLSAGIIDEDGVSSVDYVVASTCQEQGLLIPIHNEKLLSGAYITPELAKKIVSLDEEEIALFGLTQVAKSVNNRYPKARGFTPHG